MNQLLDAHYKRWMAQVIADTEAEHAKEQARRNEKARAEAMGPRERLTPLDERLTRLLTTIPMEVQREGLLLVALQAALRGRSRGKCHPGELGAALRKLGFERRRNWRGKEGFRALWRKST